MLQNIRRWLRPADPTIEAPSSLPPPDQIQADDDVSAFMHPGVDEEQRREALRALFRNSKFNRRDGLDDYDDDYSLAYTGSRIGPNHQA